VELNELEELEHQRLKPRSRWSRRGFVMTSLATGFALSVQPVSAQTITTDTNGLDAGEVKVKDGEIPAYRAMPDKGGPFLTVLVSCEIWACTSTSKISVGGSPSSAITRVRPRCSPTRAIRPKSPMCRR
jgi:hypothetical protein